MPDKQSHLQEIIQTLKSGPAFQPRRSKPSVDPLPRLYVKPPKSQLPFLHPENVPAPDCLIEKAMFEVALYLRNGFGIYRPEFYELCRSLTEDGSDWIAVEMAIRRHLAEGRVRLVKRNKPESQYDQETGEFLGNIDIEVYYVFANESLFQWWQEKLSRNTNVLTDTAGKQPLDDSAFVAAKTQDGEQQPHEVAKEPSLGQQPTTIRRLNVQKVQGSERCFKIDRKRVKLSPACANLPNGFTALIESNTPATPVNLMAKLSPKYDSNRKRFEDDKGRFNDALKAAGIAKGLYVVGDVFQLCKPPKKTPVKSVKKNGMKTVRRR